MMHYDHAPNVRPSAESRRRRGLSDYLTNVPDWLPEPVAGPESKTHYIVGFFDPSFSDKVQFEQMLRKKWTVLVANGPRWGSHISNRNASTNVDAITETIEEILDFIAAFGAESVSLTGLHAESVQGEHLAALLRASSSWRNQIIGWHDALEVARDAILRAGEDPEDALFGML